MDTITEGMWGTLPEKGMIALDTGCVYGNRLTGMVIEEDRFKVLSVQSEHRYPGGMIPASGERLTD